MGIVKIQVTARDGGRHGLQGNEGGTLMEILRDDLSEGVAAVCGGNSICGTCHVYVDEGSPVKLPAAGGDELELLKSLAGYRPNSRLSCQVGLTAALDGLAVTLAPEE